jgi:hypothetical protein
MATGTTNKAGMTRKVALQNEKHFRNLGVYKPYCTMDEGKFLVDSYPLSVTLQPEQADAIGCYHDYKITDCSLARTGNDPKVAEGRIYLGQHWPSVIAGQLKTLHPEAYKRAKDQEKQFSK